MTEPLRDFLIFLCSVDLLITIILFGVVMIWCCLEPRQFIQRYLLMARSKWWCVVSSLAGFAFIGIYFLVLNHPGVLIGGILMNVMAVTYLWRLKRDERLALGN